MPKICSDAIKVLYGTVTAFKLFFDNLTSFLVKELFFTVNTYGMCVVNKDIDGEKCTISWHVDDL